MKEKDAPQHTGLGAGFQGCHLKFYGSHYVSSGSVWATEVTWLLATGKPPPLILDDSGSALTSCSV